MSSHIARLERNAAFHGIKNLFPQHFHMTAHFATVNESLKPKINWIPKDKDKSVLRSQENIEETKQTKHITSSSLFTLFKNNLFFKETINQESQI